MTTDIAIMTTDIVPMTTDIVIMTIDTPPMTTNIVLITTDLNILMAGEGFGKILRLFQMSVANACFINPRCKLGLVGEVACKMQATAEGF